MTPASPTALSRLRALLVIALLAVVVVAMMLTSHAMAELRIASPRLSGAMSWLEVLDLPFDMDHVAFFAAMSCAARLLLPRMRWWWIGLAIAVLAGGTELLQFWAPGRTPRLLDARDDLVGGAIGLSIGALLLWLVRGVHRAAVAWRGRRARVRLARKP